MACGLCVSCLVSHGAVVLFSARHVVAVWRRSGASAYCPADLRLARSGLQAARLGLAAFAASSAGPLCAENVLVADGVGRGLAFDGVLCAGMRRHLPARPHVAPAWDGPDCCGLLCPESWTALHADHGHDGTALSGRDDLERAPAGGTCPYTQGRGVPSGIAPADFSWPGADLRCLHAVRRMDLGFLRMADCIVQSAPPLAQSRRRRVPAVHRNVGLCSAVMDGL